MRAEAAVARINVHPVFHVGVVLSVISLVAGACSGDDDAGPVDASTTVPHEPTTTTSVAEPPGDAATTAGASTTAPIAASDPTEVTGPTLTTITATSAVVTVPETGVPGLDSDDSFCAAWSRFGGSWQVLQVAANFAPDPSIVPAIEVVAAPVIAAAYDAMLAAWPEPLAPERELVADGFFGPLDRRAEAALAALTAVGATAAEREALGSAWVAALAARQPDEPVLTPELTDDQWARVDAAAAEFAAQRVDFVDDPSMRITVETPLTDAYLATACPDQGALTGGEVDGA